MVDDSQIKFLDKYKILDLRCFNELIAKELAVSQRANAASGIHSAQIVQEMINAGVNRFGISLSSVMKIILELAPFKKSS